MAKKMASLFLLLLIFFATPLFAATVSDLIERIPEYNGKTVVFRGEAIGDKMPRKGGVWVNVSDGPNSSIGVWCSPKDAQMIHTLGDYNHKGDVVEIVCVFHRACPEHVGEIDLHATTYRVVKQGSPVEHPITSSRLLLAIALALLAIFLKMICQHKLVG